MSRKPTVSLGFEERRLKITLLKGHGKSPRAIFLEMKAEGMPGSLDSFRKWFERTFPGNNNKRKSGRPKGKLIRSLGILEDLDQDNANGLTALAILVPLNSRMPQNLQTLLFNSAGLDIPLGDNYEPDYLAYAKALGRRRVQSLGDMDYYFLARWTREMRESEPKNSTEAFDFNCLVLHKALEIRSQMFEAVKPRRRRLKKK